MAIVESDLSAVQVVEVGASLAAQFDDFPDGFYPPSPNGSTKGLFVRSRPTSTTLHAEDLPFVEYGMTPAYPTGTTDPSPIILRTETRRPKPYAESMNNLAMYAGSGTGTSLRTTRTTIEPMRAVRRRATEYEAPATAEKENHRSHRRTWSIKGVKNSVSKFFTGKQLRSVEDSAEGMLSKLSEQEQTPLVQGSRRMRSQAFSLSSRARTRSLKSMKSTKNLKKGFGPGIEFHPPLHSEPSYRGLDAITVYDISDDEDEQDPIGREALGVTQAVTAQFVFEHLDQRLREMEEFTYDQEIGVAF
ncbi:hypothetical protein C8J57DRAFT_1498268 [Mycena rebaudengoi]|nr:hypothetical protein C8J57DRAFT_1498268 [Mycena rebaudengoi]